MTFGGAAGNIPLLSAQVPDVREQGEVSPEAAGTVPAAEGLLPLDDTPGEMLPGPEVSAFPTILRMVLVLVLVAVFIYIVVFFLKGFFKRISRPQEAVNPYLKILASLHLGSNRFVYVVSVGPKQAWLVGAGDSGVSLIAEIGDKETVDAMLLEDSRKTNETGKFPDFRSLLRRFGGGGGDDTGPSPENIRKRRERLRGL
ncbi:MAG: flagellar biosynthetic protein FliO [Spirochaetaceae bacterium]|nr:flagellar biosynthetic protein FliO [Spirochaetaceae bacterium]